MNGIILALPQLLIYLWRRQLFRKQFLIQITSKSFDLNLKRPVKTFILLLLTLSCFTLPYSVWAEEFSKPQRIISTSPSITEILFSIGAGNQVVGVSNFCTYPAEALEKQKIGGILNPSKETMISLKPDLIIYHYDSFTFDRFAQQMKIPSLKVSFDNLDQIYKTINYIGEATGNTDRTLKLIQGLKSGIGSYRSKLKNLKPKPTLLILGDSADPLRDLYTVGKGAFLDELLSIAGGDNIIKDSPSLYPKISREHIISSSPEVIIIAGPKANIQKQKELNRHKNAWRNMITIRAVQNHQIFYIGADYILIPGPRLVNIIEMFSKAIHPEIFGDL